jgi:hypothetical protein
MLKFDVDDEIDHGEKYRSLLNVISGALDCS